MSTGEALSWCLKLSLLRSYKLHPRVPRGRNAVSARVCRALPREVAGGLSALKVTSERPRKSAGTRLSWQRGPKPQPQKDELLFLREVRQAFWRRGVYSRAATPSARVTPVVTAGLTPHTGKMTAPPSGDCGPTFCALEFAPGRSHPGRDVTPDVADGVPDPNPRPVALLREYGRPGVRWRQLLRMPRSMRTRRCLAGTEASSRCPV